ncbi:ADP-ribosylglycohydrolase family protein [Paenarthrobacter sp. OM7]|uniref:ADP-ribosylglycohydrolase family protein n=1 Tax=Paenarthrobacter sp. OM7 TaxID=3041264 RepID=UPI002468D18C|nr:ADP-ribosylglycohydrolase family protein [Paenarthrobacter sp. OM7]WGM20278.1 ADP-ribosylglycohydrolase family protein [Paenarthrobacter sp. OM7]
MAAPSPHFPSTAFDPLSAWDLLRDEIRQRQETGYDVADVARRAETTDPHNREQVLLLVDELASVQRSAEWQYVEPEGVEAIRSSLPTAPPVAEVEASTLSDKIHAAWLGRIAGCNLGKPVELGDYWTSDHIKAYLQLAGAYPLRDYVPALDPMPAGFELRECWTETTLGNVNGSSRDDDIDYSILALHLLETHGADLSPEHVADAWTALLPLRQVFTAERAAYINITNGLTGPDIANYRNPYREWIGAQIRGDVYGYVFPGDPWKAAELAFRDASLSHVANGVYGEMWAAALISAAFTSNDATEAIKVSLSVVPPGSRLAEAIHAVLQLHKDGLDWDQALKQIQSLYGHYSWVHTVNNAALVVAGLLWGEGDYTRSVGLTVMGGWDTDSNGATVGSVAGILAGTAKLPSHLIDPLQDRVRSALFGFDNARISDLAERTFSLAVNGLK